MKDKNKSMFVLDAIFLRQEDFDQLVLFGNDKTVLYEFFCPECGVRACYRSHKLKHNRYGYVCPDGHNWEE